jgi:hypothetical protein
MLSSRSVIARALTPLTLGLLLAVSGCAGKKGGTKAPRGKAAAELEDKKETARKEAVVNLLIDQANASLQLGRYMSARRIAEEALESDPNNADAYVVLGAAAWRAGQFDESTAALRKAMELDPTNYGGAVALARNLRAVGQMAESLAVLEPAIAAEDSGFQRRSCEEFADCDEVGGWCDIEAKECRPPVGVDTRMGQLWAYYMTLDTDRGPAVADEVFLGGAGASEYTLDAVRGYSEFLRAFAGKGELVIVNGDTGNSRDAGLDIATGLPHAFAVVGGEPSRVLFSPLLIETRIDAGLASSLGLKSLGKTSLVNLGEYDVTLIPVVEFEGMKIENVPALIDDLQSLFDSSIPEPPGVILGHQVLHKLGSIVADFPAQTLSLTKAAPSSAPAGAVERPLIMLDQWSFHVPATPIRIDGSDHDIWSWFGLAGASPVGVTAKAFLKSGHLPRDIEDPEDPDNGLKMVYLDRFSFGTLETIGVGALVFLDDPGHPMLGGITAFSGFELGGIINVPAFDTLRMTWLLSQGKMWLERPAP